MFRIENDKKFGLPVFEDGCVVVAGKVWLEYVAGLTIIEIVGTCWFFDRGSFSVPYRISDQL